MYHVGAVWDGGQRKLIMGCGSGTITVYNFLQGAIMRSLPKCNTAISAMAYSVQDKVRICTCILCVLKESSCYPLFHSNNACETDASKESNDV